MRASLHAGSFLVMVLPIACAVLGWMSGRFWSGPFRNEAILTKASPVASESNPASRSEPLRRGAKIGRPMSGPVRDPFGPIEVGAPSAITDPWKGFEALRLSAIWMDPTGPVAVIDGRMVRSGDGCGGFRVTRFEPAAVWLTSTVGSRRLGLQSRPQIQPVGPRS